MWFNIERDTSTRYIHPPLKKNFPFKFPIYEIENLFNKYSRKLVQKCSLKCTNIMQLFILRQSVRPSMINCKMFNLTLFVFNQKRVYAVCMWHAPYARGAVLSNDVITACSSSNRVVLNVLQYFWVTVQWLLLIFFCTARCLVMIFFFLFFRTTQRWCIFFIVFIYIFFFFLIYT